ncbi:hypothetical protein BH11MYX3_BH11MYX3_17130 [soil metagenome]
MMNRNQFLRSSVSVAAAMFGIGALAACKEDGGVGSPDASAGTSDALRSGDAGTDASFDASTDASGIASCSANGTIVVISANHGHSLVVSKADVAAGTAKTYSIQGGSIHDHMVTVSTADFAMLAANNGISVVSTPAGHTHTITVTCAAA